MAKKLSLLAGTIALSAFAYQYNNDLKHERIALQQKLGQTSEPLALPVLDSHYMSERLVPSLKTSWNEHVTKAAHAIIYSNVPHHIGALWTTHVLGNKPE
ncbi:hypothetical protein BDF14DRAFT_1881564 [Spinellus fusiger]|nr:hypothetical protein BDF14DRAFT_1881564 [Spinellus fusiger]